jgi:hypothetical protein
LPAHPRRVGAYPALQPYPRRIDFRRARPSTSLASRGTSAFPGRSLWESASVFRPSTWPLCGSLPAFFGLPWVHVEPFRLCCRAHLAPRSALWAVLRCPGGPSARAF